MTHAEVPQAEEAWGRQLGVVPFVARRPGMASSSSASPASGAAMPQDCATHSADAPTSGRRVGRNGAELAEFGALTRFVADPSITDVFLNGPGRLWVDRGDGLIRESDPGLDENDLRTLAIRLISGGGRHIDEATPCVDVRLHDGIRVHAVLPPISPAGTLLSIRLPRVATITVDQLERDGFFADVPSDTVRELLARRRNILLTGAGGSGKTTALSALLALAAPNDRIVAIEDVAELRVDHPHFVSLEARQANLEGAGEIGLQRLVREALRMRPDRLVVGECRGAEIRELLSALNTGHDGGAGTLHANSLADVPARIEALGALAGLGPTEIARQTVSAIDMVLHLERRGGSRRLASMGRFALDARDRLRMVEASVDG